MAFSEKKGISLASGFKLQAEAPLDARTVVDTIEERDELVTIHAAYEGLQVYVTATKETYEYHGADGWVKSVTGVAYVHPTTPGYMHLPAGGSAGQFVKWKSAGTGEWVTPTKSMVGLGDVDNTSDLNKPISTATQAALDEKSDKTHIHDAATAAKNGFMSKEDFSKLANIEAEANKYIHPTTHSIDMITESTTKKVMTAAERTKLAGVEEGANKYVLPSTLPISMMTETDALKVMTTAERDKLTGIEAGANKYIHPSSHAATMITEDTTHRFMTDDERTKLQGIAAEANKYIHPDSHALSMITETDTLKIMTAAERTKLAGVEAGANKYVHPAAHAATMITQDATHRFVTDVEKAKYDAKADVLFAENVPATAPVGAICYALNRVATA